MELDFIKNCLQPIAGENSLALTDDCAVFGEFVITKDVLSSGTHFFAEDDPFNLARKALRVNLSDLAAMGAEPFGFLLGLSLPKNTSAEWLQKFTAGLKSDINEFGIQLLGGDTITHNAPLNISVTAIGKTPKPILRSGAKVGDNIFVSGKIGEAYVGMHNRQKDNKYELPIPRIALGVSLREVATAAIDVSDGLLLDLWRLCQASGVGASLDSAQIPLASSIMAGLTRHPSGSSVNNQDGLRLEGRNDDMLMKLISSGDDYELLFTSPAEKVENCYKIGKIIEGGFLLDGAEVKPNGYVH